MVDYLGQWRWYCMPDLYARTSRRCSDGSWRSMAMHRLILDAIDSHLVVDHINRDKLDNRRSNLRLVESVINRQNTGSFGGSSVFRGVYWEASKRRWRARIMLNGKKYALGYFGDERDAALAVETFRAERMPWVAPDNALAEQKWWPPRGKLRFIEAAEWPS
jgi:hypothetical protein